MEEISGTVKEGMEFVFVKSMPEGIENITAEGESVWK